jgi:uncharacterized protein YbaR (Trm112 family)
MTEDSQPAGSVAPEGDPALETPGQGPARAVASTAQIEPWLREILRCPKCRSTLSDGSGPTGPELHCTNAECRLAYRVDDGIPVLLIDESRSLAG